MRGLFSPRLSSLRTTLNSFSRPARQGTVRLGVETQQVVHVELESGDGSFEIEGVVRAMPVVVVEEGVKAL